MKPDRSNHSRKRGKAGEGEGRLKCDSELWPDLGMKAIVMVIVEHWGRGERALAVLVAVDTQ